MLQPRLEMLPEGSNESLYDTIQPRPSSIKTKNLNVSLFSRVRDILESRENLKSFGIDIGGNMTTDTGDHVHICQINPRIHDEENDEENHEENENKKNESLHNDSSKTKSKNSKLYNMYHGKVLSELEIPVDKCNTIIKRLKYYNRLCDMANILRHIRYYFNQDIPVFKYKAIQFMGNGPFIFFDGHSKYLNDFKKHDVFKLEDDEYIKSNNELSGLLRFRPQTSILSKYTHDITKTGIFTIYQYLLNYVMIRTIHNYPILIYKDFVWYESYIYMRTIPLKYILASRISHGPVSCKMCKEYAHPTLKIFQNYCEFCFKEIKKDIKQQYDVE